MHTTTSGCAPPELSSLSTLFRNKASLIPMTDTNISFTSEAWKDALISFFVAHNLSQQMSACTLSWTVTKVWLQPHQVRVLCKWLPLIILTLYGSSESQIIKLSKLSKRLKWAHYFLHEQRECVFLGVLQRHYCSCLQRGVSYIYTEITWQLYDIPCTSCITWQVKAPVWWLWLPEKSVFSFRVSRPLRRQ